MLHVNEKKFEKDYFEESHFSKMGGYDLLTKLNQWRPKKYRKIILENTTFHRNLLDIGCAYGHFLELVKNDFEIYGMDISNHAIQVAEKRVSCDYLQGNLELDGIPFSKKFDIITAISVIEHLENPQKGLQEIYDHLAKGGIFCAEIPTISNKMSSIFYKIFFSHDDTHIFIVSVDEIDKLLTSVGFKKIAIYSSTFPIFTKMKKFVDNFSFAFFVYKK